MKKYFVIFLLFVLFSFQCKKLENADIAITHVSIIDVTGNPTLQDMTVLIRKNRIINIGKSSRVIIGANTKIIDGVNKYIIPGLWDMHVHWFEEKYLPLFISNGVVGLRQMWGMPENFRWREQRQKDEKFFPRQSIASTIIDGPNPIWPGSISVGTELYGREIVNRMSKGGADFIKIYSLLPRNVFIAIANECKKLGIPFAGHIPDAVSAEEASNAGQKSMEHLVGILLASSSLEDQFRDERRQVMLKQSNYESLRKVWQEQTIPILESYDIEKASKLFNTLAKNNTWQCPTLVANRAAYYMDDESFINDSRLKYIPRSLRSSWNPKNDSRFDNIGKDYWDIKKKWFKKELEITKSMHISGVKFIAGTDVGNPYVFPGFSLHDELELFVHAGLTPLEALQTATINAAIYNNQLESTGTIEEGKIADLVLLDADPLEDIRNTKQICAVIYDGQIIYRQELQNMFQKVEELADRISIADTLYAILMKNEMKEAKRKYYYLKQNFQDEYNFDFEELNMLGYYLLEMKKTKEAFAVMKLNLEAYPQNPRAYESLGEAYLSVGDYILAVKNYEKSLKLDTNNEFTRQLIESMKHRLD